MNLRDDRWFVRFRGHTLGPLTTEQVEISLRNRELSDADKIASSKNPAWSPIAAHPAFTQVVSTLRAPAVTLAPIPPPQEIWQRKARNRAAELATFTPEEPGAIPGINARSSPLFAQSSTDGVNRGPTTSYKPYSHDPSARVIHPNANAAEANRKPKRVAAPGKKLGRPRKNPLPTVAEAAPVVDRSELSIVDLVAPILEAAPASVAAPIFDVEPKLQPSPAAPLPVAPETAKAPPSAASETDAPPPRPAMASGVDFHVPPPAMPVRLDAALATFDAEPEMPAEVSPALAAALAEEAAVWSEEPAVEASPVPAEVFEAVAVPAIEERAEKEEELKPTAAVEEAPVPAPLKVEAAPAVALAAEPAPSQEKLAVESLALLESLRDWRRKEEELEQSIRAKNATPERPVMPVSEPYRPEAFVAVAPVVPRPSLGTSLLASVRANKNLLLAAIAVALFVAGGVYLAVQKTRGPGNQSFPNPSGSASQPTSKEDPTPSLRAPTRPQRD